MTALQPSSAPYPCAGSVAIIVNTYNQNEFLRDALTSSLTQSRPADIVLVVDDGSADDPRDLVASFAGVRYLRQANAGLAAARNAGLAAVDCDFILFLDADDRLLPGAVAAGLECLSTNPHGWLAYGAHRIIDRAGVVRSRSWHTPIGADPLLALLAQGNLIAMHGAVLYRTAQLRMVGGFDPALRRCEDYDAYLRIADAGAGTIVGHAMLVAEYRHHGTNMSRRAAAMLATALAVIGQPRQSLTPAALISARRAGRATMRRHYCPEIAIDAARNILHGDLTAKPIGGLVRAIGSAPLTFAKTIAGRIARKLAKQLPASVGRWLPPALWSPRVGQVDFGDFERTRPIGAVFGFDRGQPVDRHYIDLFLAKHRGVIMGRVLEIGDNSYTMQFGGEAVTTSDILHIHGGNPAATFVGDIADPATLPPNTFDCIVLTQTLHLIFDMRTALGTLHAALKPGGSLIITVPGISPIEPWEWRDSWFWSLTTPALTRLLAEHFAAEQITAQAYGNVYAAISFLAGLATAELDPAKLNAADRDFPVLVGAVATKSRNG